MRRARHERQLLQTRAGNDAGAPVVTPAAPGTSGNSASVTTNVTVNTCQQVEEWTYNPGYGQFMTMLQFEGGSLKSIRYGDRVMR
jgi:hypothetical protein